MRYPREHKQLTKERILEGAAHAFREQGIEAVGIARLMHELGLTHGGFYAHFASKAALAAAACARALARNRSRFAAVARSAMSAEGAGADRAISAEATLGAAAAIATEGALKARDAIEADRPVAARGAGNAAGAIGTDGAGAVIAGGTDGTEGLGASARGVGAAGVAATEEPSRRGVRAILASYLTAEHRDSPGAGCAIAALGAEVARQPPEVRRAFTAGLEVQLEGLATLLPGATSDQRQDLAIALMAGLVGALTIARAVDDGTLSDRILAAARSALESLASPRSPETTGGRGVKAGKAARCAAR